MRSSNKDMRQLVIDIVFACMPKFTYALLLRTYDRIQNTEICKYAKHAKHVIVHAFACMQINEYANACSKSAYVNLRIHANL